MLASMFPAALVGRANSALNVLHLTAACAVQAGMGAVIARWAPGQQGHYPVLAYRVAFAMPLAVQIAALALFVLIGPATNEAELVLPLDERIAQAE